MNPSILHPNSGSPRQGSLIGREDERARIIAALERPDGGENVALTVLGGAGMGKSHLVMAVVARWRPAVERCVVELAPVADRGRSEEEGDEDGGCVATIARALGLSPTGTGADVRRALKARGAFLLVLDNADRSVSDLAHWLPQWLAAAPSLRVVCTSRQRLRIRAEEVLMLGPLSCEGGAGSEAGRLFAERVRQLGHGDTLDEDTISQWCGWLEGVPLAIELAAARAPFLQREKGQRQLDVLAGGYRDGEPRHATLRRAIAWSWQRLDEEEQATLSQASVFSGPFHVGVTAHVMAGNGENSRGVIDRLRVLADRSFLKVRNDGKLELFDAVREFAAEARPAERASALMRLDAYLAAQAQGQGAAVDVLRADVLGAAERTLSGDVSLDEDQRAWVLLAAAERLISEGPPSRLESLARRGLAALGQAHGDLRTRLRIALASALRLQGRFDAAEQVAAEAMADESALLDTLRTALLIEKGLAHHGRRDLDGAHALYTRALTHAPSRREEGRLLANLGAIAHDQGELEHAESRYREALVALGLCGDQRLLGVTRSNLALLLQEQGDLDRAQGLFDRALDELGRAGEHLLGAIHRSNLGQLMLEQVSVATAQSHGGGAVLSPTQQAEVQASVLCQASSLQTLRRIGDPRSLSLCLCRLGAAHALAGDVSDAEACFEEAKALAAGHEDVLAAAVVAVYEAFGPLGRALTADEAPTIRRRLDACLACLRSIDETAGTWRLSDDARAARRMLERWLHRLGTDESEVPQHALAVSLEARFFRLPGEDTWQDLRKQQAVRRILEHLVQRHRREAATMAALQEAAWPGERMRRDAASNRIHVALSRLRKLGLKPWLQRDGDGYRLDPELIVLRVRHSSMGS